MNKVRKEENKLDSISLLPPLSSVLIPAPDGPTPVPIPPNTPGVAVYGVVVVPVPVPVVGVVPVPVVGVVPVTGVVPVVGVVEVLGVVPVPVDGVTVVPAVLKNKRNSSSQHINRKHKKLNKVARK